MIRNRLLFVALLACLPVSLRAQQDKPFPIYLTISGGIAAGSYQSGVNWAILQAIRLSKNGEFLKRHGLGTAPFALGGMTGASAGNINAIMTALEYCRSVDERDPRESLFWKMWIPTGITNMLNAEDTPAGYTADRAVFDRAFFDSLHFKTINSFGAGDRLRRNCTVPLGITVTKQQPDTFTVMSGLTVPVTRHAITFTFKTGVDTVPYPFVFEDAAVKRGKAHFGQRLWLKSGVSKYMVFQDLYPAIKASSAFPVAFAPETLTYSKDSTCRAEPQCQYRKALFIDGGVFDNNPVDVMVGLRRFEADTANNNSKSLLIYLDQDELRGPKQMVKPDSGRLGLHGILELGKSFVAAGRSYELQSLAKSIDLDSGAYDVPNHAIRVSDRRFPVIGLEYGAFAAFFGTPFREFDFYLGVYDGIHAVATLLAGAQTKPVRTDTAVRMRALIQDSTLIAFDADRALLLKFLNREFPPDAGTAAASPQAPTIRHSQRDGMDHHRFDVYSSLADASFKLSALDSLKYQLDLRRKSMSKGAAAKDTTLKGDTLRVTCRDLALSGALCKSRFGYYVDAADAQLPKSAANTLKAHCENRLKGRKEWQKIARIECSVDSDFITLRDKREHGLNLYVTRILSRLRANEDDTMGTMATRAAVGVTGLTINQMAADRRYGRFWFAGVSTIPRLNAFRCLRCWAPYKITFMPGWSGIETEWRLVEARKNKWGALVSVSPMVYHRPSRDPRTTGLPLGTSVPWAYASVGAGFLLPSVPCELPLIKKAIEQWEVQWRVYAPWRHNLLTDDAEAFHPQSLDILTRLGGGRIQLGARFFPDNRGEAPSPISRRFGGPTTLGGGSPWTVLLSIPDVPGLLYWFKPAKAKPAG